MNRTIVDRKNPMYGKTHSPEARRKISESRNKYLMEKHPRWRGGRRINHNGYVEIRNHNHHRSRKNGYVFEHILVAEKMIGRKLFENEIVHHKNEIKTDNRPENLEVLKRSYHTVLHSKSRRKGSYLKCVVCGKEYYKKPSHVKKSKCCSLKCVGKYTNLKGKGVLE